MRALIADDHSIIRMALKYMLREIDPQVEITETATTGDAEAALEAGAFDLVITDLFMPGGGPQSLGVLVHAAQPAPVVVFTVSENPEDVRAAMDAGVRAYVPKTTEDPLIVSILRLVMAGGTYVPPQLAGLKRGAVEQPDRVPAMAAMGRVDSAMAGVADAMADAAVTTALRLPPLTRRQQQVLELLAQGLSNAEIGSRLGLNLSTVKSHVTGVLRALNVVSRTQAVLAFKQSDWSRRI